MFILYLAIRRLVAGDGYPGGAAMSDPYAISLLSCFAGILLLVLGSWVLGRR
jgi:hypothetical protein